MTDVFSIQDFKFPTNFLWGSAVAGHQVEGNNIHSNNWYNEQQTLKVNPNYEVSGMACNHYNMYREDVLLLKELGHRAFRLSIEWARIEPEEGRFLQTELDHYIKELAFLKENGIQTFVTMVHFSVPLWFAKKGDFRIVYLAEYLSAMNEAIKSGVDLRGYLYWSFLDNYEWSTYIPKFGLVEVDYENNFKRTPKPSAYFYKEIIENNGFSQKILKKYIKNMPRVDTSLPIII